MARIFVYADSPTAPTGFGRSARHVLYALHAAGHELVQLAVNHNPATTGEIPWRVYTPTKPGDPYGLTDLPRILQGEKPFDLFWTTFDPECPWAYHVPGIEPQLTVLGLLTSLRQSNPGFRMMGWFPVDGGPLSDFELAVLGSPQTFDLVATMSTHVHDLVAWTLKLKGNAVDPKLVSERIKIVPHGVEMGAYVITDDEGRRAAKARLGFDPDVFLVVQVERNQPRKQPYHGLALIEAIRTRNPKRPVALWQHMQDDEETKGCGVGFRMRELAWRYGLKQDVDVRWPQGQLSDAEMVRTVYAAADVVFSGSSGEGFQYPLWEALACGRRVVAPADSARKAWLSHTPGATLYECDPHGVVIRGGYNRRTSIPNIEAAATIVAKMIEGKKQYAEVPQASRNWVAQRANVAFVQKWWTEAVADQVRLLAEDRLARKATVTEPADVVVDIRANLGLGDLVMAAPAMRALRAARPGQRICLALPPGPLHRPLAEWLDMADVFQTQPSIPIEKLAPEVLTPSTLWHPLAAADKDWMGGVINRTDLIGRRLNLPTTTSYDASFPCPEGLAKAARNQVAQRYGVQANDCIILACESAQRNRTLPETYIASLAGMIRAAGLYPMLIGRVPLNIETVGVINLTGKTDLMATLGLIGVARAMVAVDSFPMHVAGAMGRPMVALMSCHLPQGRLAHYKGPMQVLTPQHEKLAGETWPAGEYCSHLWVDSFRPGIIARALGDLLGDRDMFAPKVVPA